MNKKILGLVLAVGLMVASGVQAAFMIDDFSTPGSGQTVVADGSDTIVAANAVGGFRTIAMNETIPTPPAVATARVIPGPNVFTHSSDDGVAATSLITWDANGVGLGVDFSNYNVFELDFISIDQGGAEYSIILTDLLMNTSTVSKTGLVDGLNVFNFSEFLANEPLFNFSQVNIISLQVKGALSSDLIISQLQVNSVPEPDSLTLLMFSIAVFGFARRKA